MKIKVLSAAFISTQNLRWRVWKTLDILRWFIGFTHLLLDKVQTQQTFWLSFVRFSPEMLYGYSMSRWTFFLLKMRQFFAVFILLIKNFFIFNLPKATDGMDALTFNA